MPVIQPYEDQIVAQGGINSQATPGDFGAQIGQGMQQVGQGLMQVGDVAMKLEQQKQAALADSEATKLRTYFTEELERRKNTAEPGDSSFAPKFIEDMDKVFGERAGVFTTGASRRYWDRISNGIKNEFGTRAVYAQGDLARKGAINNHTELLKGSANVAFADATQVPQLHARVVEAIDNPDSLYASLDQADRDKLKTEATNRITYAANEGEVKRNPAGFLQRVSPELFAQFKPWQSVIQRYLAPNAKLDVKPEVEAKAHEFVEASSPRGLAPNVLMAQADLGADGQSPEDLAATMGVLTDKFGGDMGKALAAYHWGAENLNQTMENWQENWEYHIPANTAEYVNTVMLKSGSVENLDAPPPTLQAPPPAPQAQVQAAFAPPAGMEGLSYEQVAKLTDLAYNENNTRKRAALEMMQFEEIQKKEAQEGIMNTMLQKIVEPKKYGRLTSSEVLADQTIDWKQKQHMVDYMLARSRELQSASEARTNPGEFKRLFFQIHAADTDPTKVYNADAVMESYKQGRISTNEMFTLRREAEQMKEGGDTFGKEVSRASGAVRDFFLKSIENLGPQMAGTAAEGWYRFHQDLTEQIAAKRALNEDPRSLLDPKSSEYLLGPERLQRFMNNKGDILQQAATATAKEQVKTLPTYKEFASLKSGQAFTDPQGKVRVKP